MPSRKPSSNPDPRPLEWPSPFPSPSQFPFPSPSPKALAVVLLAGLALALLADAASAQAATGDLFIWRDYQDPAAAAKPAEPLWVQALWFVAKLGFVIGLILVSLLMYKRMLGARAPMDLGRVRILETTRLAGTQSLHLVQVGEQILLLGSNGAGLLTKLSEWPLDQGPPPAAEVAFGRTLQKAATSGDDFNTVIDSSLRQAVIPPRPEA